MILIILFAFLQGLTEFLPVSSQGHLILFNDTFNLAETSNLTALEMNIIAHFGSILAIMCFYFQTLKKWVFSVRMIIRPDLDTDIFLLHNIVFSSLPIFLFGYFFAKYFNYENQATLTLIAFTSIIFGFLIYFIDKYCLRIKNIDNLGYKLSLLIGLFQCVALIPGVSRSGSIITCMRFLGFRREFAVKYSNLLSIPTIIGATSFLILDSDFSINTVIIYNLYSFLIFFFSFIFSLIFIFFFVNWVKKFSLSIFAAYRVIFGLALIMYIYI